MNKEELQAKFGVSVFYRWKDVPKIYFTRSSLKEKGIFIPKGEPPHAIKARGYHGNYYFLYRKLEFEKNNSMKEVQVIYVPQYKIEEMEKVADIVKLAEYQQLKATVFWKNIEYGITGSMGNGTGKGVKKIYAHRVEDTLTYKGSLKPLERSEHFDEVKKGNRERGYEGEIVYYKNRTLVFCEAYEFELEKTVQATLF